MTITRYPSGSSGIQPTIPVADNYVNASSVASTWYTLTNVTNGKGILSRISAFSTATSNLSLQITITVDGTAYTITQSEANNARGFVHGASTNDSSKNIDFWCNVYFSTSLKIEVRQTEGTKILHASSDYSLS